VGLNAIFSGAINPIGIFFTALILAAFVVEAFAFGDAISRPAQVFTATGKQSKKIWLLITGVACAVGVFVAWYGVFLSFFLAIAAFVAAAIYMVDVRPKVKEIGKGGGSSSYGPYGPW
jgi:4-amino-4-deoxy-L-arabinose transferase-like glycosyltransferase